MKKLRPNRVRVILIESCSECDVIDCPERIAECDKPYLYQQETQSCPPPNSCPLVKGGSIKVKTSRFGEL